MRYDEGEACPFLVIVDVQHVHATRKSCQVDRYHTAINQAAELPDIYNMTIRIHHIHRKGLIDICQETDIELATARIRIHTDRMGKDVMTLNAIIHRYIHKR